MRITALILFLSLSAQAAVVSIKDPNADYQMKVNSDGSINVNGGGSTIGTVDQGMAGTDPWPVTTTPVTVSTSSITVVTVSANTSTQLIPANSGRNGVNIFDQTGTNCLIALASTSSSSSFSFILVPFQNYNMDVPIYKGAISANCSNNGILAITEF